MTQCGRWKRHRRALGRHVGKLTRLHQDQWQSYTIKNSALRPDTASALAATPDGLWVGTFEGRTFTRTSGPIPPRIAPCPTIGCGHWKQRRTGSGSVQSGLAHFRQGPPPEIADFIGRPEKDRITQSRHTFAVIPFDPTYQTILDRFHYYWVLTHAIAHRHAR